jgi:hypothetical protein
MNKGFFFIYDDVKWHQVSCKVFTEHKGTKAFAIKFDIVYIYSDLDIIIENIEWKNFKTDFLQIPELTKEQKIEALKEQLNYLALIKSN